MREGEPEYWDSVSRQTSLRNGGLRDNWPKRRKLGEMLMRWDWVGANVLEIGVGCGVTAAMLSLACGRMWEYIGTDVSQEFISQAGHFGLDVVQADILSLPEGRFNRVLALDSLEHVHPDDRDAGYKAIADRMETGALLFINMPYDESSHDMKFDHGIGLEDLVLFEKKGLNLLKYEHYTLKYKTFIRQYAFVVMTKGTQ